MRSPWNEGSISLRCDMWAASSRSSTEWWPRTGSSTTFASPACSTRGSPVKTSLTAAGWPVRAGARGAPRRAPEPRTRESRQPLPEQLGVRGDVGRERREVLRVDLMRPVAERGLGIVVDLDDDAVGPRGRRRPGERPDEPPVARGVGRIDDDRQVRVELEPGDRPDVEREPHCGLEGADAALAEHDALVPLLEHVVGGHEELVERRGEAALEEDRLVELADHLEQAVVL